MQSFEELSRELERRGKAEKLRSLADSAAGRGLAASPEAAALAAAAAGGDGKSLQRLLGGILSTPEGRQLLADVQKLMKD